VQGALGHLHLLLLLVLMTVTGHWQRIKKY
jgi:hypothetical protein